LKEPTPTPTPIPGGCPAGTAFDLSLTANLGIGTPLTAGAVLCVNGSGVVIGEIVNGLPYPSLSV
jgi:hypothetical protein